jgi:hypothetical protein
MAHLDAVVGIIVLMAISLWIVGKARSDTPFIARILHPDREHRPTGPREDDDVRWRWHAP